MRTLMFVCPVILVLIHPRHLTFHRDKTTLHYHDMPAHIYRSDLVEGSVKKPLLHVHVYI